MAFVHLHSMCTLFSWINDVQLSAFSCMGSIGLDKMRRHLCIGIVCAPCLRYLEGESCMIRPFLPCAHRACTNGWDDDGTMEATWQKCFLQSKCDAVVSVGLASNCTSLRVCVAIVGEMSVGSVDEPSGDSGQWQHRWMATMTRRVW